MKRIPFLFAYCICALLPVQAQNLIKNGGFEQHGRIECLSCYHIYGKYASVVYHWDNAGWGSWLWDTGYKLQAGDIKGGAYPFEKMAPQEGKVMVEMNYSFSSKYGSASFLYAPLNKSVKIGEIYEVSYWLYIPKSDDFDPVWAKHIGCAIVPEKKSIYRFTTTRDIASLTIDSVQYDVWYQVKWNVRLNCTGAYLLIGPFADQNWPSIRSYKDATYYIDNVSVRAIKDTELSEEDHIVSYCYKSKNTDNSGYEQFTPRFDDIQLFFANGLSDLTEQHKVTLDSFAIRAKKYPAIVFEIKGHTDSIGQGNQELSFRRAEAVHRYLTTFCKIPDFRLILQGVGSAQPLVSNNAASGRQLNRRTEIKQAYIDVNGMLYRRALKAAAAGAPQEAFAYLNKWLRSPQKVKGMYVLFDPRFNAMRRDKRWGMIAGKARQEYQQFKKPDIAWLFDSLHMDDKLSRGELEWAFAELSPDSIAFRPEPLADSIIENKCMAHFRTTEPLFKRYGWPKRSEVGTSASVSAFMILQHSLDSAAYYRWLPELQKACEAGEADWMNYAMLYDRCNLVAGKPQRYATHSVVTDDGIRVEPWEGDLQTINAHRTRLGLPLVPEFIAHAMKKQQNTGQ